MPQKLTAQTSHSMMKAKQREEFIQAGGYDGRYRSKSVPSKKQYSRKEKHRKANFEG